ncbi:transcriptional regulator [Aeromicrobium sp. PE09-221]|uniref:ArsR/SmtB family transcription factor n=2 Tax=Bacillati TaxID=1783272 RepID=UPI000B3E7E38|nr:metalloregulator ArsR/SmtB family transcription factor [Aeromicrobium sp. PE09-221]OUZ07623.1 transcriptional regulator [Aeromicrobium sp. PE09-221]
MDESGNLAKTAQLLKVLGNESRLRLLLLLSERPMTVGALAETTGMSQPLVSQHLRTLRHTGVVVATRDGKEISYALADAHVSHVIADALVHAQEPAAADGAAD